MRVKAEAIFEFGVDDDQRPNKIVREYREEYKLVGGILDQHSEILDMVHVDLAQLSKATSTRGRRAEFTSENLFRAILVMQREGLDYREASIRIAESETLQNFCRLIKKRSIDFTLLNKAYCAIRPETWESINNFLGLRAVADEAISIDDLRTDTTVTECNIHWPTDSSLLWDTYRVIAREMSRARQIDPLSVPWRFHLKKIKNMDFFIARYSNCTF
jgi:IS5 family transposase